MLDDPKLRIADKPSPRITLMLVTIILFRLHLSTDSVPSDTSMPIDIHIYGAF